jgi:hypothetical protein
MRKTGRNQRRGGGRGAAALIAVLVLPGCSATSSFPSFSNPFSSSTPAPTQVAATPATTPAAPAAPAAPTFDQQDCPTVDIRAGAGTMSVAGQSGDTSATGVRYQLSFDRLARQCTLVGTTLVMKVGVQGRIVVGPSGGPGQVEVPLRYAVVKEGPEPKVIVSKFKRFAAAVTSEQTSEFSDVQDDLSFPLPSSKDLDAYVVYVGFDELGDASEKKPAKKPAPPKRK